MGSIASGSISSQRPAYRNMEMTRERNVKSRFKMHMHKEIIKKDGKGAHQVHI